MLLMLFAAQAAAAAPADIEFRATVRARSLTIEKRGTAELVVTADPPGRTIVDIRAPQAEGRKTIRNPEITADVKAHIAPPTDETARTPPR